MALALIGLLLVLFPQSLLIKIVKPGHKGAPNFLEYKPQVPTEEPRSEEERKEPLLTEFKEDKTGPRAVRVVGNLEIPDGGEVLEDLIVVGKLKVGDRAHLRNIKAKNDVTIGDAVIIEGNLISGGNVHIGKTSTIKGTLHCTGNVRIGERSCVEVGVVAGGDVEMSQGAQSGEIQAKGIIRVLKEKKKYVLKPALKPIVSKTPVLEKTVELNETELKVLKLVSERKSMPEISLRLFRDQVQLKKIVDGLVRKGYLNHDHDLTKLGVEQISLTRDEDKVG